jgi:hypothetical protein
MSSIVEGDRITCPKSGFEVSVTSLIEPYLTSGQALDLFQEVKNTGDEEKIRAVRSMALRIRSRELDYLKRTT